MRPVNQISIRYLVSFPQTQVKFCGSELGISSDRASMLYTYMAIAFFFSNHLLCKLSELKCLDIFDLYQFTTTCLGICLLLLPLAKSYKAVVTLSVLYGLMDGGRYGLMPLIVLECVGEKRTDQAWGYVAFCVGLSAAIGPTVIGEQRGSFSILISPWVPKFYLACFRGQVVGPKRET